MINLLETTDIKEQIQNNPSAILEIIETASMGICITNAQGNFVAVNNQYSNIYGYSKDELIGNSFTMVVPTDNQTKLSNLHDKFIRDKSEVARNWIVVNKAGEPMEISVDTGYSEAIFDQTPHKITFVHRETT